MSSNGAPRHETEHDDIAIVGMACLYPGADGIESYWRNIVEKIDSITDPPADWQPELFLDEGTSSTDKVYVGKGGYLGDLCRFDPIRYGVVPNSVEGSEPDQFIALRCAFDALEDAGHPEVPINTERTGVILGRGTYANRGYFSLLQHGFVVDQVLSVVRQVQPDFGEDKLALLKTELKRNLPPSNAETAPGVAHSVLVGRIANRLNLNGPAYTIDAACASSLLAVEHGMRELRAGTCDAVIAGGVQVSTCGLVSLIFCHLQALSRTGTIAPLSANANGTLLGSGCGVLVLKRRRDAERDGNRIYCLLKSVGVASDGRAAGLLAPVSAGQQLAVSRAYELAGVSPETVELVEAHATGIQLGDSTELETLRASFGGRDGRRPSVALGSVKSQIGHLIPAAGSASLIKTALAIYHRVLPPTLHAEQPNEHFSSGDSRFYLNSEARPWVHGDANVPRRAGINAFGFGGINAHAVLEEHGRSETTETLDRTWPVELVVVSAADREQLRARAAELADWLESAHGSRLLDIAATCAAQSGPTRLAICASDVADLVKKLRRSVNLLAEPEREKIQDRQGIFWYQAPLARQGRVGLVFPGEGSQYVGMLSELCRHFPEVRRQFDLTDRASLSSAPADRPARMVYPLPSERGDADSELFHLEWAVESVAAANRALFALVQKLKIDAHAAVGHSSGEFVALWAAGALDIDDESELVKCIADGTACTREIIERDLVPPAVLTTVGGVPRELVEQIVAEVPGLEIAMDNCPNQLVIVGDEVSAGTGVEMLRKKGAICQRFPWDRAYHTESFRAASEPLSRYIESIPIRKPSLELWSCSTAAPYPTDAESIRELAVRQWSTPVRFRSTVDAMYDAGVRVFVEVGPRGNLTAFIRDSLKGRPHLAVALNVPRGGELAQLTQALAMLAAHGVELDLEYLSRRRTPRMLDFDLAPPPPATRDPVLRLDLPELEIDSAVLTAMHSSAPPADGNGFPETRATATPKSTPHSVNGGYDEKERALADYQKTMREFLALQERMMTLSKNQTPPHE